ncbi:hypothetical protein DFJ74DRAFT_688228 [Hyaloraphidium curvatum]|nr:hypothetical protein DFJ74DRAFT_688228 [Hyaloraphidium curvatum]
MATARLIILLVATLAFTRAQASPIAPAATSVLFRRSCGDCPDTHDLCEFGFPGAPDGSVACVAYDVENPDLVSLYKRYAAADDGFCNALTTCAPGTTWDADRGVCQCPDGIPVGTVGQTYYAPLDADSRCPSIYSGVNAVGTYVYSITSGNFDYGLGTTDARPMRYVIRSGSMCGTVLVDTGMRGRVDQGCALSAPCCPSSQGGSCTGTAGASCPDGPVPDANGWIEGTINLAAATDLYVHAFGCAHPNSFDTVNRSPFYNHIVARRRTSTATCTNVVGKPMEFYFQPADAGLSTITRTVAGATLTVKDFLPQPPGTPIGGILLGQSCFSGSQHRSARSFNMTITGPAGSYTLRQYRISPGDFQLTFPTIDFVGGPDCQSFGNALGWSIDKTPEPDVFYTNATAPYYVVDEYWNHMGCSCTINSGDVVQVFVHAPPQSDCPSTTGPPGQRVGLFSLVFTPDSS